MIDEPRGSPELSTETAPREFGTSAAAPRSAERELGVISFKNTKEGGDWQSDEMGPRGVWPEERELNLDGVPVEGWVAGAPVVDGVADTGWTECPGGRVRLVVNVRDCPEQREWVRAMSHGGAYAKEVLG